MSDIYAYTPAESPMPPYINVGMEEDGRIKIMVRSPAPESTHAYIHLSREEARKLGSFLTKICDDQF